MYDFFFGNTTYLTENFDWRDMVGQAATHYSNTRMQRKLFFHCLIWLKFLYKLELTFPKLIFVFPQ